MSSSSCCRTPPPPGLLCPLSLSVMTHPVSTPCGHNFERERIVQWIQEHKNCPIDNKILRENDLADNLDVASRVADYVHTKNRGCLCKSGHSSGV